MLNSIIEELKKVNDFRKNRGKRHELWVVLSIVILALLTGHVTYRQIDNFRKSSANKLINFLEIPSKKLPSYSTIRRAIIGVNSREIQWVFQSIVEKYYSQQSSLDWIAIDGKSLKNTLTNYESKSQNLLVIISWFSQTTKLVIKSEGFDSKHESENVKVISMIETCGLTNKVFTLDALHCSQQTTRTIIDSKNDYLITVKGNQVKLHERIKSLAKTQEPLTVYQSTDNSHGREVTRKVSVFDGFDVRHKNYPHLKSFMEVERTGFRGKKEYKQTLYYISSQLLSAEIVAERIRGHWLIENQVHWVKDVVFNEDKSRIKNREVALKFSLLVTLILNFYRSWGFISIKDGQSWLGNNWEKIWALA